MTLGFNENGTVSSYAPGIEPPGGRTVVVRQDEHDMLKDYIQREETMGTTQNSPLSVEALLPVEDRVMIVRALVDKADMLRKMTLQKKYKGDSQFETGCRRAFRFEASECERVAKKLCEAWGLRWKDRR